MPESIHARTPALPGEDPHQLIEDAAADLRSMSQGLELLLQLLLSTEGRLGIDRLSALALHGLLHPYGQALGGYAHALDQAAAQLSQS